MGGGEGGRGIVSVAGGAGEACDRRGAEEVSSDRARKLPTATYELERALGLAASRRSKLLGPKWGIWHEL